MQGVKKGANNNSINRQSIDEESINQEELEDEVNQERQRKVEEDEKDLELEMMVSAMQEN